MSGSGSVLPVAVVCQQERRAVALAGARDTPRPWPSRRRRPPSLPRGRTASQERDCCTCRMARSPGGAELGGWLARTRARVRVARGCCVLYTPARQSVRGLFRQTQHSHAGVADDEETGVGGAQLAMRNGSCITASSDKPRGLSRELMTAAAGGRRATDATQLHTLTVRRSWVGALSCHVCATLCACSEAALATSLAWHGGGATSTRGKQK